MSAPPPLVNTALFFRREQSESRGCERAYEQRPATEPAARPDSGGGLPIVRCDEDARFALPGGGGVHVALLFDGASLDGARALAELGKSALVGWCALLEPVAIDVGQATETGRWFGLQSVPALVAIWDGAVLAIEYDFDPPALQALAAAADKRYRELEPDR